MFAFHPKRKPLRLFNVHLKESRRNFSSALVGAVVFFKQLDQFCFKLISATVLRRRFECIHGRSVIVCAAANACSEIQGARIVREKGQPFFFLPMFGFADPESIPPLPRDYGEAA